MTSGDDAALTAPVVADVDQSHLVPHPPADESVDPDKQGGNHHGGGE